jgi:hypothetical protein
MPVSPFCAFSATAASAATYCSFDVGGAYDSYTLVIPAMTSGTTHALEVSDASDGTYYKLYHAPTSASAPTEILIQSALTAVGVGLPNTLGRYFRIRRETVPSATSVTYKILCKGT